MPCASKSSAVLSDRASNALSNGILVVHKSFKGSKTYDAILEVVKVCSIFRTEVYILLCERRFVMVVFCSPDDILRLVHGHDLWEISVLSHGKHLDLLKGLDVVEVAAWCGKASVSRCEY